MAKNATWKFILCRSADLKPYGELLDASDKRLQLALNAAGNASFSMPMDAPLSEYVWPIEAGIIAYRYGESGPQAIWSGYINGIDEDYQSGKMQVNCVGWVERLSKRYLREKMQFTSIDSGSILSSLLLAAGGTFATGTSQNTFSDGVTFYWPAGSVPNGPAWLSYGGTLPDEGAGGATAYASQLISISYEKDQGILQAIQDLTQLENGPNFYVDPLTRALYVHRKRRRILPSIVFGYNWGPENLVQFNRQIDGSTLDNYQVTTGMSGLRGQAVSDVASQQKYGPFEERTNLSDVNSENVLLTFSQAEIAIKKNPRNLFSVTPYPWTDENSSPEPFIDYRIGDQVVLVARRLPRINVNTQVRIFGMDVSISAEGNEILGSLSLYPS